MVACGCTGANRYYCKRGYGAVMYARIINLVGSKSPINITKKKQYFDRIQIFHFILLLILITTITLPLVMLGALGFGKSHVLI